MASRSPGTCNSIFSISNGVPTGVGFVVTGACTARGVARRERASVSTSKRSPQPRARIRHVRPPTMVGPDSATAVGDVTRQWPAVAGFFFFVSRQRWIPSRIDATHAGRASPAYDGYIYGDWKITDAHARPTSMLHRYELSSVNRRRFISVFNRVYRIQAWILTFPYDLTVPGPSGEHFG